MDIKDKMFKVIEHLQKEFSAIRSERAHPSLLENLQADVYGQTMNLKDVASISVGDAKTLIVTVWDAGNVAAVDKAIRHTTLSLNPRIESNKLYILLPAITQERRQEFIALVKQKAEQAKVSLRNIRREANDMYKQENKQESLSDDDLKQQLKTTQNLTDEYTHKIDELLKKKQISIEAP